MATVLALQKFEGRIFSSLLKGNPLQNVLTKVT